MEEKIREAVSDVLLITGAGLLVYGVWRLCPDAGWFAAGAACIAYGCLLNRGGNE